MEARDFRLVIKTAIITLSLFLIWKFVPVYYAATRFKVEVYEAARDGAMFRGDADFIRKRILWSAQHLDIPIKDEDLIVDVDQKAKVVTARAAYEVPVNLVFTAVHLKFLTATAPVVMVTADDLKVPGTVPGETSTPSASGQGLPRDWDKNPPARDNSQSVN